MSVSDDKVDVLVIGAGASGAAFTWSLVKDGFDVLCLEQGGWVDPSQYPSTLPDWETHRQTDFNANPNVRALPEDYPVNDSDSAIAPLMYNAVGGSTIHWSAHFPRFHPSDFRTKTLDGVADDWPLTYDVLEPYFDTNDRIMGVAGITGDTAYPPKSERQTPPLPLGHAGRVMARGFDKLGWHWWPSDATILTAPYDGRAACNNCGPCDIGCTRRAKASTDVTYWPKALTLGARLKTNCRVREITLNSRGLADGVIYYDADGNVSEQKANSVVLACNGVGTPRLMLNSCSPQFPDGIANSSGLVGKNLMFHPYSILFGTFDERIDGYMGRWGPTSSPRSSTRPIYPEASCVDTPSRSTAASDPSPPPATAMAQAGFPGDQNTMRRTMRSLDIRCILLSSAKTFPKSTTRSCSTLISPTATASPPQR